MNKPQQYGHADVSVLKSELRYQGFYQMRALTVRHRTYHGDAITIERELMVRPDAVVVLLYDPGPDEVVLIEQYRVGAHKAPTPWLIECVAGLIDEGESTAEVARREVQEEAGLAVERLKLICEYFPSPGGTDEKITLYVGQVDATQAAGVHGLDHEGEDILVRRVSVEQALAWLSEGHINNAATVISLQWLALNRESLRVEWSVT